MSTVTARLNTLESTMDEILALLKGSATAPAKTARKARVVTPPVNTFVTDMAAKRLARRESTPLGGLTKAERKAIAATLPRGYTRAQWTRAVKAHKAAH